MLLRNYHIFRKGRETVYDIEYFKKFECPHFIGASFEELENRLGITYWRGAIDQPWVYLMIPTALKEMNMKAKLPIRYNKMIIFG